MRCVIVAAGRGSRLGDLTSGAPKCLVPFLGETLLSRMLRILEAGGVTDFTIVGGYRSGDIQPVVDVDRDHRELIVNEAWDHTNMVQSLMCASARLRAAPCLISYGDIFYSEHIVRALIADNAPLSLAFDPNGRDLWERRFDEPLSDLENFTRHPDGALRTIGGRVTDIDRVEGQYMGLIRIEPKGFEELRTALTSLPDANQLNIDMTSLISIMLARGVPIGTMPNHDVWGELDTPGDIAFFEKILAGSSTDHRLRL